MIGPDQDDAGMMGVLTVCGIALIGAAAWVAWPTVAPALATLIGKAAPVALDYLHVGPHCPGADPGWLGRCSLAPMN